MRTSGTVRVPPLSAALVLTASRAAICQAPEGAVGPSHTPTLEALRAQPEAGGGYHWRIFLRPSDPDADLYDSLTVRVEDRAGDMSLPRSPEFAIIATPSPTAGPRSRASSAT